MKTPMHASEDVTRLLKDWRAGDSLALDQLVPIVYESLRTIAGRCLRSEDPNTLSATVLVHEAYLKLVHQPSVDWQNRAHFFGIAAQVMRHILVDHARGHTRDKRGAGQQFCVFGRRISVFSREVG